MEDCDGATLEPFTPRVFRCRASFTTACFEFVRVDLFVCYNRWNSEGGRAGRPLLLRSGASVCAEPGLLLTSFLFRFSVNLSQVVDINLKSGLPRCLE